MDGSLRVNTPKNRQTKVHALVPQCALSVLSYSECKIAKILLDKALDI